MSSPNPFVVEIEEFGFIVLSKRKSNFFYESVVYTAILREWLVTSAADSVAGAAFRLTESADKKKIRLAKEVLAQRNGLIYRFHTYSRTEFIQRLFTIDERLKISLNTLGLSEDQWLQIAKKLFYLGVLKKESRDPNDYSKKNSKSIREHMLTDWATDSILKYTAKYLNEAFQYFKIKKSEWIEYGDAVVGMYNLEEDKDLIEFGIITAIMPMKNNHHLL